MMDERDLQHVLVDIAGIKRFCPAGETWLDYVTTTGRLPIGLPAPSATSREKIYPRCRCAKMLAAAPSSTIDYPLQAHKGADRDDCFMECIGGVLNRVIDEGKIGPAESLDLYRRLTGVYIAEYMSETERTAAIAKAAEDIVARLKACDDAAR